MANLIFTKKNAREVINSVESNLLNRLVKHKEIAYPKLNLETLNLDVDGFEFINIHGTKDSITEIYLKPKEHCYLVLKVTLKDKQNMKDCVYTVNYHNVIKEHLTHALLELAFGVPSFDNVYYENIENLTDRDIILKQLEQHEVKIKTTTDETNIVIFTFKRKDTVFSFKFIDNILIAMETNNPYLLPRLKGEARRKYKKIDWTTTTSVNSFDVSPKYILGLAKRLSEI